MKCHNCQKNALYFVGPKGQQTPLCLNCFERYQSILFRRQEFLGRQYNHAASQMESIIGLPGIVSKYPERKYVVREGGITLNNINVSNSEIGVLNTGTIGQLDCTVSVIKSEGSSDLAKAFTELSEVVIKSTEVSDEIKNQLLELLNALSSEAIAPEEKRKMAVAKAIFSQIPNIVAGAKLLLVVWEKLKPIIGKQFGF